MSAAKRKSAPKTPRKTGAKPAPKKRAVRRAPSELQKVVIAALEDMKAVNIQILDVRGLSDFADVMVVASGNSDRHVKSIADRVVQQVKASGTKPFGVEGARDGEWVLVDLNDIVLHVMLPRVREHYGLEQLWEAHTASRRE